MNGGFPSKLQLWQKYITVGPLGRAAYSVEVLWKAVNSPGDKSFQANNQGNSTPALLEKL